MVTVADVDLSGWYEHPDGSVYDGNYPLSARNIDPYEGLLYNSAAKALLKSRFENGYVAGTGFNDDITKTIADSVTFLANPSQWRPDISDGINETPREGQPLHTTALYAYAIDDVSMANVVATEILGIVGVNDLNTAYWDTTATARWDLAFFWTRSAKMHKLKDSYYFVKHLQTVLSAADKTAIETWFARYAELAFIGVSQRFEGFFGAGWNADNLTGGYYTGDLFAGRGAYPIQDSSSNDLSPFFMTLPQDIYNNRFWDSMNYIHGWAVKNGNLEMETYVREYFKVTLKYGVFPDGTSWEMRRNGDASPTSGLGYINITSGAMVLVAHIDATAGSFPNDKLYDYSTSDGVTNGSFALSATAYAGGNTTDGVTQKSLLTFLKANTKYLRTAANGGWNDTRFYKSTDLTLTPLDSTGKHMASTHLAIANLYYKDAELVDAYMFNTAVGYPVKQSLSEGYIAGVGDQDMGQWGNMIFGAAWYGQEGNFFI